MQSFRLLSLLFLSFLQHHFSDTPFPRDRCLGPFVSQVALTEGWENVGTSANVHLTRTSLAISHFESLNIHILNQASPLAQLLPSIAISIPLNSLLGSDCSLWRMADDGGETQSALISLGWLSCTWRLYTWVLSTKNVVWGVHLKPRQLM